MPARRFDGRRVRAVRRAAELVQCQVAQAVGVRDTAVASWETGHSSPPPEKLPALARALGRDLDELFPRDGLPDLADLRADAGYAQRDTKAVTRTKSTGAVANAERGRRRLGDALVQPLAAAYGVSVEALLTAQERSFGHEVPAPPSRPTAEPTTRPAVESATETATGPFAGQEPRSIAEKIAGLLRLSKPAARPTHAELATRGNERFGQPVLCERLVAELHSGAVTEAPPEALKALALALDAPELFFSSHDREVDRIVSGIRLVRDGFTGMAARGRDGGVPAELMDYISEMFQEIRRTELPDPPHPSDRP
ncbi:helix-turn-helix transcriptional regulator [Streptomyces sp. NPDC090442]|uniref:helix-turn-helix transcriptional regulator n=1 Tax=Streptomyces sp. NPDC090442 TaxID=3365962 RepID=UPI00381F096A